MKSKLGIGCSILVCVFISLLEAADELVVYSGRSKSLVDPIIKQFGKESGVKIKVKYGNTAQLALTLMEEGDKSPADIFWAQDGGALGAISKRGQLAELPSNILSLVPKKFRASSKQDWVATSGRARVIAYATNHVKPEEVPDSVFALTDPTWKGRVGWAPRNASFQSFITAMRILVGEGKTENWLQAMKDNGTKSYPKNTPIIQALAAGEIHLGLPNHYYLLRFKKSNSNFPVNQKPFQAGDPGNLVNIAGVGILKTSQRPKLAQQLVRYLLSAKAQQYFSSQVFEYAVTDQVIPTPQLLSLDELEHLAPSINLSQLDDTEGTLKLLRRVGLL